MTETWQGVAAEDVDEIDTATAQHPRSSVGGYPSPGGT